MTDVPGGFSVFILLPGSGLSDILYFCCSLQSPVHIYRNHVADTYRLLSLRILYLTLFLAPPLGELAPQGLRGGTLVWQSASAKEIGFPLTQRGRSDFERLGQLPGLSVYNP